MAHPEMYDEDDPVLARLRGVCLAMPEATEKASHGRPAFRVGKIFAVYGGGVKLSPGHHEPHDQALLILPALEDQFALGQDERFFLPAYYGPYGWLGLDLPKPDGDWEEVVELVDASYRRVAPARLLRGLDG